MTTTDTLNIIEDIAVIWGGSLLLVLAPVLGIGVAYLIYKWAKFHMKY